MPERLPRIQALKDRLAKALTERIPEIKINGHPTQCLPHLFSVSVEYIEGESLVMMLDEEGIIVATRSACASGSLRASHVLIGTGLGHALAQGTLVFTLGIDNTEADIDKVIAGDAGHRPDPAGDVAPLQERAHRLRLISQLRVD